MDTPAPVIPAKAGIQRVADANDEPKTLAKSRKMGETNS